MPDPPAPDPELPHDVLAADEFALGSADPKLHQEPPDEILAAEAFAVGEGDRSLHREEAHDVLAAEEFAMPAPEPRAVPPEYPRDDPRRASGRPSPRWPALGLAAFLALRLLRRERD